jgi:hypothetical protein
VKIELRGIKNGVVVSVDGVETYYETADQAAKKVLPMIHGLLSDWQRQKEGKVTMVFELLRIA